MRQLMHSFEGFAAPDALLEAIRRGEIAAICLFRYKNVQSPMQVRALTASLAQAAEQGGHLPPIICIDQEGGQLIAISEGATELPGNMALGATRSPELAAQAGMVLGRELLAMGVNLDLAPSLDVNVNPENPVIGIRAFGDDPALVAELGSAMIEGMHGTGILAAAKHFPGHGDTASDTHHGQAIVSHSMERMNAVELLPFRAAIDKGVDAILTAHVRFSALDDQLPATLSPAILDGFLRRKMGFGGLIITDAMDMYAVAQYGAETSLRRALAAGADLALLGHLPDQLNLGQRLGVVERGDALARIQAARRKVQREQPPLDVVGCAEHQYIAQTIADQSITLVRDANRLLPLRPGANGIIAVITPRPVDLTPADTSSQVEIALADAIRRRCANVRQYELSPQADTNEIAAIVEATDEAETVIVGTISVERDASQIRLVEALHGRRLIVVAMRTPYDLVSFPMVETYLCAYGIRPVTMEAVARVLFGEIEARGVLPCAIPGILLG